MAEINNLVAWIKEIPENVRTHYEDVIIELDEKLKRKDQEIDELKKEIEKYKRYCRAFSGDFS